ncbi:hypothetical protein Btru_055559 [Bulinus truncatus]|nr:hypothetical protein Btru_055559 [Bulinus truncatus]
MTPRNWDCDKYVVDHDATDLVEDTQSGKDKENSSEKKTGNSNKQANASSKKDDDTDLSIQFTKAIFMKNFELAFIIWKSLKRPIKAALLAVKMIKKMMSLIDDGNLDERETLKEQITSKIKVIEERANEVWNYQFFLITIKYYNKLFLPLPFTILTPLLWICTQGRQDGPFYQEILPTELSNLQRIEASMRFKFIQDVDDQHISVICNGVVLCQHKAETKIMRSNETQTERVLPLTIGLWPKPPHHQNPLEQTKRLLLPPNENAGTTEFNETVVSGSGQSGFEVNKSSPPAEGLLTETRESSNLSYDDSPSDFGKSTFEK